jgi:glucosamine kinase
MTIVGIDGGGTRTRIALERDGEVTFHERPVSLKVQNGNHLVAAHSLQTLLGETVQDDTIGALCLGLSGMSQPADQQSFEQALRSLPEFSHTRIHIEGDATLTLNAALGKDGDGILLIAGTGSVAFARKAGKIFRVGGWGPTVSDEGSGYWIGRRAMQHYVRGIEGLDELDDLSYAISAVLPEGLRDNPSAIAKQAAGDGGWLASFAPIPFEKLQTSQRAREIVHGAARELEKLVRTAANAAELSLPIALHLHGSIATNRTMLAELRRATSEEEFKLSVLESTAPAYAALGVARVLTTQ